MPLTIAQLQIVKAELANDPNGYGYGNDAQSDASDATQLMTSRSEIRANRSGVQWSEVAGEVHTNDYDSLTADQKSLYNSYSSSSTVSFAKGDGTASAVQSNLKIWFPDGTSTRTGLDTIFTRDGTRIEQLIPGFIGVVTASDVANARNL